MNLDDIIRNDFKATCEKIKDTCNKKYNEDVVIKEESSNTSYGLQFLIDIIFLHLINEDHYGLVFSLIIKNTEFKSIEISLIRSNGPIIELKDFDLSDDFEKDIKMIRAYLNRLSIKLLEEIGSILN